MSHIAAEISEPVVVGPGPLGTDVLVDVALHGAKVRLSDGAIGQRRMAACEARRAKAVADGTPIYGVTTGFGSNCGTRISSESALALGTGLLCFHGCGTGPALSVAAVRGAMLCRILCLGRKLAAGA
jgi:histidine ammonia-lyase